MKNAVVWFDLPAADLDRAMQFYSAVLLAPLEQQSMEGCAMALLPHEGEGAVGGCIYQDEKAGAPVTGGPLLYLNVNGRLEHAVEMVEQHGGKILTPVEQIGPWGFRAVVQDSEGNRVALHSLTAAVS